MFFRKRNREATERVQELKARVESLRHADESHDQAPMSLNDFLEGDDVLTAREADSDPAPPYDPESLHVWLTTPPRPDMPEPSTEAEDEEELVDLEAELQRYLARQEERERMRAALESQAPGPESLSSDGDDEVREEVAEWPLWSAKGESPSTDADAPDRDEPAPEEYSLAGR